MRGRNVSYSELEPDILGILKESTVPMSALGINFRINDKLNRVIELNTVKHQLSILVKSRKVLEKPRNNTIYYKINTRKRLN